MKYKINRKNKKKNVCASYKLNDGYFLSSSKRSFVIAGMKVKDIIVLDPLAQQALASKRIKGKYEKLLKQVTELIVENDESGSSSREALNLIEKFRLEVKNKYRHYLGEKELKQMANQLKKMQQIAIQKEVEITMKMMETEEYMGKSR